MLTASIGQRVLWSYRHHLNATSSTTVTKKGIVTKIGRKRVHVLFDGNKTTKLMHISQLREDTKMNEPTKLFVKLTKNPTWGFETEGKARHTQTFDKNNPRALEGMLREILQMTYHHYGCQKAEAMIGGLCKGNAEFYKDIHP